MEMKNLVQRINFLYKKSKETGLTNDEIKEQKILRDRYIDIIKSNFKCQLDTVEKSFIDKL